jgi:predicted DCC family thiol-disulfide oxidoreductase YuxK
MVPVAFWKRVNKVFVYKHPRLVIFYDEECPLCNRTKIILSHLDACQALEFKGVQTSGFENPKFAHLSKDQLLDNIYSVTKGGKILSGVDTYKYAFKKLPATLLLGWLMSIPGVYHLAKLVYNQIAKNRYVERCNEENCGYIPLNIPIEIDTIKISQTLRIKDLKIGFAALGIAFLIVLQLLITYNSPIVKKFKNKIGLENRFVDRALMKVSAFSEKYAKVYLGITHHALFMDYHFNGYNHIIAVEAEDIQGKRYWLPIIDKNGYMDRYIYGPNWAKWTFRTDAPLIDNEKLKNGVRDFTSFWAVKQGKDPKKLKYLVHVKRVDSASEWEIDFLHKQTSKPWVNAGVANWNGDTFTWNVSNIESLK